MAATKMRLKLLVDQRSHTVLFAEAGKDFVDFLFHCLALPVGTVISFLTNAGTAGSLGNLYKSIENLNDIYLKPNQKESLLKPKLPSSGPEFPLLLPEASSSAPTNYYRCSNPSASRCNYVTDAPSAKCPHCNYSMSIRLSWVVGPAASSSSKASGDEGGYVKGVVTYMVMDDLVVKPMSTISCITLIKFNEKEIGDLEEKVIDIWMDEVRRPTPF